MKDIPKSVLSVFGRSDAFSSFALKIGCQLFDQRILFAGSFWLQKFCAFSTEAVSVIHFVDVSNDIKPKKWKYLAEWFPTLQHHENGESDPNWAAILALTFRLFMAYFDEIMGINLDEAITRHEQQYQRRIDISEGNKLFL